MFKLLTGGYTPEIRDRAGRKPERSIAEIVKVRLGGLDQYLIIRGHDDRNPVLLFLHGGPGGVEAGSLRKFNHPLEEHFTVVHWEQRGAGKSYSEAIPLESLTIDQLVQDAEEAAHYLLQRFHQEKLYVVGHSWGTTLGMLLAQRCPELIHAYIGVNQAVLRSEEESGSYRFALEQAHKKGDAKAIQALEQLGPPPNGLYESLDDVIKFKDWLGRMGGVTRDDKVMKKWVFANLLAHEYTLRERFRYLAGLKFSMKAMWGQFAAVNLFKQVPAVEVPVTFIMGRHDHILDLDIAQRYFDQLQAPSKELIIFEDAGHLANVEDPAQFHDIMINRILSR